MNTEYLFRREEYDEAEEILSLYRSALGDPFCTWNEYYPAESEIRYDLGGDNLFVLTDGQKIIGACSIITENEYDSLQCWQNPSAGEIARIVVHPEYRGRRLAQSMVEYLAEELRRRGKHAIHLLVACKNIPACRTYMRCGFAVTGNVRMYENDYCTCEKIL